MARMGTVSGLGGGMRGDLAGGRGSSIHSNGGVAPVDVETNLGLPQPQFYGATLVGIGPNLVGHNPATFIKEIVHCPTVHN